MPTNHSLYKNKKKWDSASNEKKLCSYLNRSKNRIKSLSFKRMMEHYVLKEQIRSDSILLNDLRELHPEIFKEIIEIHDKKVGKSKKKEERMIDFIEKNTPSKNTGLYLKVEKLKEKLIKKIEGRKNG